MIRQLWNRLLQTGESFLGAPTRPCAYCGVLTKRYASPVLPICSRCAEQIPWIETVRCPRCGRGESCPDCSRRGSSGLLFNRGAVNYDRTMKEWLATYKYRGNERLSVLLAAMLYMTYKRHEKEFTAMGAIHWITYVPVSAERLEERGFNQARQLAARLGERTGIPVVPLLDRNRNTAKQSYQSRAERQKNVRDAFVADENGIKWILKNTPFQPINIVIVDDVYTTGSTMHHCAETIGKRVKANVYGLTWAR